MKARAWGIILLLGGEYVGEPGEEIVKEMGIELSKEWSYSVPQIPSFSTHRANRTSSKT